MSELVSELSLHEVMQGCDEITRKESEKSERALLYVIVTRARKQVLITGQKPLSRFFHDVYVVKYERE